MNYIGIDIGKTLNVACRLGKPSTLFEFKNTSKGIEGFKKWLLAYPSARVVVEATGGYQNKLVWSLQRIDCDVRLINPILARRKKIVSLRKLKTDDHDAEVLAEMARDDKGTKWIANPDQFRHRLLGKMYDKVSHQLVQEKSRCERLAELWKETGSKCPQWFEEKMVEPLKELKKQITTLLEKIEDPLIERLTTIPGISRRGASMIVAEVGSFDRFKRIEQFIAYTGLDPSTTQSGGKAHRHGHLSKRGSPILRTVFYQAAMTTWRKKFRKEYDLQRDRGRSYIETVLIIGRKIARISYALAKTVNETYVDI